MLALAAMLMLAPAWSDGANTKPITVDKKPQVKSEASAAPTPRSDEAAPKSDSAAHAISAKPQANGQANVDWWTMAFTGGTAAFTGLLVIVGGGQLLMFLWQLRIMKQSLKDSSGMALSAKQSADAAAFAVQAAIKSERPWLVVNVAKRAFGDPFTFACINQGRTPAKVISISRRLHFADRADEPFPPAYDSPVTMGNSDLIVNKDSFPIGPGINVDSFLRTSGVEALVNEARKFLLCYGNVVYRDTYFAESASEGLHETRWCFVYDISEKIFRRFGPSGFNAYS